MRQGEFFVLESGNAHNPFEGHLVVFDKSVPFTKAYVIDEDTQHRFLVDIEWLRPTKDGASKLVREAIDRLSKAEYMLLQSRGTLDGILAANIEGIRHKLERALTAPEWK